MARGATVRARRSRLTMMAIGCSGGTTKTMGCPFALLKPAVSSIIESGAVTTSNDRLSPRSAAASAVPADQLY